METLLSQLFPDWLNNFFSFLAMPIFENGFIHFGWFFIHATASFFLYYILKFKLKEKRPVLFAFIFIILFEIFEFLISYGLPIILKETFFDTLGDLAIGGFFIILAWLIFGKNKV